MSDVISVYDSHTHVPALVIDEPVSKFLQNRYFPTDDRDDTFDTTDVVLDFADADHGISAYVQKGFIDATLPGYATNTVTPPRMAIKSLVDPKNRQRTEFERLCRQVGEVRPTKAQAYDALTRKTAMRLANRNTRLMERQVVDVLVNNAIRGQIPTSPTDDTPVDIEIRYYQLKEDAARPGVMIGNEQRMKPAIPWGQVGATPYRDVQNMVRTLIKHGGRAKELLIAPEAWILLQEDKDFLAKFTACPRQHEGELGPNRAVDDDERGEAEYVGWIAFFGHRLDIIVYSGMYFDQDEKEWHPYLPKDFVCVLSPNVGHTLCAATTFVNPLALQYDDYENGYITVAGKYAMSKFIDVNNQTVEIRCESNPCAAPRAHWGWITMLAENSNDISSATEGPFAEVSLVSLLDSATYNSNALPYVLAKQAASGSKIVLNSSLVADSDSEYTFDHFEADGQTVTPDGDNKIVVPIENTQIELVFKSVITFDKNGGSGTNMATQGIQFGESAALSKNTYTKSGKTFLGWATASDGDVVYDDEEVIEPEGNMTLYAVWSE